MTRQSIEGQLEKILGSSVFRRCARMARFLRMIVEKALAGEAAELKEYSIGVEVYEKEIGFDPRVDSIVRVEARRLRRKLGEYYKAEGEFDPILISIKEGSYIPVFRERLETPDLERSGLEINLLSRVQTLAVLPFSSFASERDVRSICHALTEELISAFARTLKVRVVPYRSVCRFRGIASDVRQIGSELNVAAVVEGRIRRAGARLRVTVSLINVADGLTSWSQVYEPMAKRVALLQGELSEDIVRDVSSHFTGAPAEHRRTDAVVAGSDHVAE